VLCRSFVRAEPSRTEELPAPRMWGNAVLILPQISLWLSGTTEIFRSQSCGFNNLDESTANTGSQTNRLKIRSATAHPAPRYAVPARRQRDAPWSS